MDVLWAPWRMSYVSGEKPPAGCLFCDAREPGDDAQRGILARGPSALVMLNAFPYSSGHLMVAPVRHVASLEGLSDDEGLEVLRLCRRGLAAIRTVYRPDGFNLGINEGRAAGAGVDGHVHLHIVPRWMGDTNFMPAVASVKVMPEGLDDTFRRLRPHLAP
jgi:ATP adenylyltransferase